ncbi:hypothetical protein MTsPCn9_34300 [Croceitalea sp. MTPC9]|uniref:hypothetical protein n=1 Tax=unclassified Croceitalea TaxID=2632280 RepID=UPI002B387981|nr:hypothetical protein MTsPCn6_34650 [Croceitalea sp. MTPC6]GMN18490.1 hypothetical protein MTsPCn9_34300 [Croceitalea sp. MTPC9]
MKKYLFILLIIGLYSCDDKDAQPIESFDIEYNLVSRTSSALEFSFSIIDTDFPSYTISSFAPNISCCQGTFILENNVSATIGQTDVLSSTVTGDNSFDLTIDNFNDGMNYLTIKVDNGFNVFFYSFQFYYDAGANEVDYLNVMRSGKSELNLFDAIFRFDYYTNANINVLIELESGIRENPLTSLPNGAGEFRYITSGGGTDIVKTTRERL